MTAQTQIRIDSEIKREATKLFAELGLDMSSAVNLFLYQCVLTGGLPFNIQLPEYKRETLDAMDEAKRIAVDSNAESYSSVNELKAALVDEI